MQCMTVRELRALLNNLPDDMQVLTPVRVEGADAPLRANSISVRRVEVIMHRRTQQPMYVLPAKMKADADRGIETRNCLFLG